MAKADIYNINPKGDKGPRNAFDLSHSSLFTSPCGELLPCYAEEVKAGDKLKLAVHNITRTRSVNTAAFMSFDEKIDFWFVPYDLIWSSYEQWRLSQTVRRSTLDLNNVGLQDLLPHTTWGSIGDYFVASHTPTTKTNPGVPTNASALRLLDMLGYGLLPFSNVTMNISSGDDTDLTLGKKIQSYYQSLASSGLKMNYFRLAAFQCIYMSSYRNEEYELLDPSYYNCDSLFIGNGNTYPGPINVAVPNLSTPTYLLVETTTPTLSLEKLFTPRYKNWRKDLFTSLKPTSGFSANGPASNPTGMHGSDFSWPNNSGSKLLPQSYYNTFSNVYQALAGDGHVTDDGYVTIAAGLYAHNIRLLMSQDKFSRLMIYADKNYSSQMRAIFGVDVKEPNVPRYLGSFANSVDINEVVATAAGSDGDSTEAGQSSVLGQLAGKGYGNRSDRVFEESFGKDGIVMGIHYIMPKNNYDAYRLNRFNTKVSRWDYYYPQFDGLGLQPVFAYERNLTTSISDNGGTVVGSPTTLLGYAARFSEYKCRQSETHGCFASMQPDNNWTLSNNVFGILSAGSFANYKILPNITDRIFDMQYDGSQSTDPFLCYMNFQVTKVSNMEILGVPSF